MQTAKLIKAKPISDTYLQCISIGSWRKTQVSNEPLSRIQFNVANLITN